MPKWMSFFIINANLKAYTNTDCVTTVFAEKEGMPLCETAC